MSVQRFEVRQGRRREDGDSSVERRGVEGVCAELEGDRLERDEEGLGCQFTRTFSGRSDRNSSLLKEKEGTERASLEENARMRERTVMESR